VIADGFYEWRTDGKAKVPYFITRDDGAPFAFAGLWQEDRDAKGEPRRSFAILTSPPNKVVAPIHDRMPVMLMPEWENSWIDPRADMDELQAAFKPYPSVLMETWEVGRDVNNPLIDDPRLLARVTRPEDIAA
jgi:putative SOS response-associated peptidase YedK